jgi:hypothetical protein
MPCATPMRSTRGLVARARIRSPSARPPGSTPTISASNDSTESPANTVRTTAFWPGRSASGASVGTVGEAASAALAASDPAARSRTSRRGSARMSGDVSK